MSARQPFVAAGAHIVAWAHAAANRRDRPRGLARCCAACSPKGHDRALPGARPAAARRPARARPDRARRPHRPALVSQRAARRGHRRAPGRVDPRPAARLDRGAQRRSPRGAWSRRPSARASQRFVFFSALGASTHHRARLLRAKALAEQAVREAGLRTTVFAPSIVYAPGDRWLTLLERLALLPVVPVSGRGRAVFQPIWAEDVADCVRRGAAARRAPTTARATALRAGRPRDAQPQRDRARRVLRSLRPRPPARARPDAARLAHAAAARARDAAPTRVRHLGRGRADGGPDDLRRGGADARAPRRRAPADGGGAREPARAPARGAVARRAARHGRTPSAHGRAASSCAASASSAPSPAGRPTSCTPSGSPSSPWNSGSEIAGCPVRVEDGREGREQARARERLHRVRRRGVERAERQRALGERGREQRVVGCEEGHELAREAPAAARPAPRPCDRVHAAAPSRRSPSSSAPCPRRSARARRRARVGDRERDVVGEDGAEELAAGRLELPRRIDLLDLVPERAQQLGGVVDGRRADRVDDRVGDRADAWSPRSAAAESPRSRARGAAGRRPRRTARTAAAPRWRRRAHSRRARRGSRPCRRRCA